MSSYTGMSVQRLKNGKIDSVQVTDPHGNSFPLAPEIYIQRRVKPPIDQLPDIQDHKPVASGTDISPVVLALPKWIQGGQVSDDALYRMQQFGFVYSNQNGQFQITESGKQTLSDNRLL